LTPFEPIDNTIKQNIQFYDWVFIEVQEDWIIDNTLSNVKPEDKTGVIKNQIPNNILKLLKQLNADCYKCREIACKKLKHLPNHDYIYMFWARRFDSLEIKNHIPHILGFHARCKLKHGGTFCSDCQNLTQFWPLSLLQAKENRFSVLESFGRINGDDIIY
jgi:hypothetical protein